MGLTRHPQYISQFNKQYVHADKLIRYDLLFILYGWDNSFNPITKCNLHVASYVQYMYS